MGVKTIVKLSISLVVLVLVMGGVGYVVMNSESVPFESVCQPNNEKYTKLCDNVNKRARTRKNLKLLNDKDFGKIIGVAWRDRGGKISAPGQRVRTSESNSYYYIIAGNKKGYYFLRLASETDAK